MAMLDVTIDGLNDPLFLDNFLVERRQDVIGNNGRTSPVVTRTAQIGVVTATSPNELERLEGFQVNGRAITVVTKFKLQGEVTGYQPDIIVWRGDNYVVKRVDYYPQFGQGFYQADCTSMDKTDVAFPQLIASKLALNDKTNSQLIPLIG